MILWLGLKTSAEKAFPSKKLTYFSRSPSILLQNMAKSLQMNYTDNLPSNSTSTNKKVVFMHNLANISLQRNIRERHAQRHAPRPSFWRKTPDTKNLQQAIFELPQASVSKRGLIWYVELLRSTTSNYLRQNFAGPDLLTLLEISGWNAMQLSQTGRLFDLRRKQIKI